VKIPFTVEQFLGVFQLYNEAIWPAQIVAYALGLLAIILALKKTTYSGRVASFVLSLFWLWMGTVYHILFFSTINKAAYVFGAAFIAQGLLFFIFGVLKPQLVFEFRLDVFSLTGLAFILYAMVAYPALGYLLGHGYPHSPCFGVAPCPTTIFTFGVLLWADRNVPKVLLVIPFIWSVIGFSAALSLSVREDIGLLVAAVLGTILIIIKDRLRSKKATA
jgi:hypothetical protein